MKNHTKFWIVFSLVVVFGAGIAGGILLDQKIIGEKPGEERKKGESVRFPTLDIMAEELNLATEQQEQIREVFRNNDERLTVLRGQIHEQFSAIRSQLKEEIEIILTDEQKIKFEAMIQKYLSQRKKQREGKRGHTEKHDSSKKKDG